MLLAPALPAACSPDRHLIPEVTVLPVRTGEKGEARGLGTQTFRPCLGGNFLGRDTALSSLRSLLDSLLLLQLHPLPASCLVTLTRLRDDAASSSANDTTSNTADDSDCSFFTAMLPRLRLRVRLPAALARAVKQRALMLFSSLRRRAASMFTATPLVSFSLLCAQVDLPDGSHRHLALPAPAMLAAAAGASAPPAFALTAPLPPVRLGLAPASAAVARAGAFETRVDARLPVVPLAERSTVSLVLVGLLSAPGPRWHRQPQCAAPDGDGGREALSGDADSGNEDIVGGGDDDDAALEGLAVVLSDVISFDVRSPSGDRGAAW